MIILFVGGMGSGKTLSMTRQSLLWFLTTSANIAARRLILSCGRSTFARRVGGSPMVACCVKGARPRNEGSGHESGVREGPGVPERGEELLSDLSGCPV